MLQRLTDPGRDFLLVRLDESCSQCIRVVSPLPHFHQAVRVSRTALSFEAGCERLDKLTDSLLPVFLQEDPSPPPARFAGDSVPPADLALVVVASSPEKELKSARRESVPLCRRAS